MPTVGPIELTIVLVIALVILGPKRLPAAGRSLGQGLREFRDGMTARDATTEPRAPACGDRNEGP
jgi:sec-independent protein translocase protein TatA